MGTARSICEITSGGVNIMPKTKHKTRTIPLYSLILFLLRISKEINIFTINGT
jgi:hypothetical protein